jgi:hypothetical protein
MVMFAYHGRWLTGGRESAMIGLLEFVVALPVGINRLSCFRLRRWNSEAELGVEACLRGENANM